jgi:hypothetical protein
MRGSTIIVQGLLFLGTGGCGVAAVLANNGSGGSPPSQQQQFDDRPPARYAAAAAVVNRSSRHGMLNVLDFGAVGDGVTDCAQAFQRAINLAQSQYRALFVPAGIYRINSALVVNRTTPSTGKYSPSTRHFRVAPLRLVGEVRLPLELWHRMTLVLLLVGASM